VGTDDGNVWQTENGGTNWTNISSGLPLRWITRVAVDPYDENIVYTTLSGYRYDSYLPHVFRSSDAGGTWEDITGTLPEAPANDIIVDPALDSTLYLATDFGVYVTRNLGAYWQMLGDNLPNVPVVDLDFHQPTRTLVAASYGRSMYSFNVDQLVSVSEQINQAEVITVFPNPVNQVLNFACNLKEDAQYSILDLNGRMICNGKLAGGDSEYRIGVTALRTGNYILRLKAGNRILTAKFTKY
jgi:hypothetical protein